MSRIQVKVKSMSQIQTKVKMETFATGPWVFYVVGSHSSRGVNSTNMECDKWAAWGSDMLKLVCFTVIVIRVLLT